MDKNFKGAKNLSGGKQVTQVGWSLSPLPPPPNEKASERFLFLEFS